MRALVSLHGPCNRLLLSSPISRRLFTTPLLLELKLQKTHAQSLHSRLRSPIRQARLARLFHAPDSYIQPPSRWEQYKGNIMVIIVSSICIPLTILYYIAKRKSEKKNDRRLLTFLEQNFEFSSSNLRDGRWWTLCSSSLMHHHPLHLLMNLVGLSSFGPMVANTLGAGMFVMIWIGAALSASVMQLAWDVLYRDYYTKSKVAGQSDASRGNDRENKSIGASGSVLAYFTIAASLAPWAKVMLFPIPFGIPIRTTLIGAATATSTSMLMGWAPGIGHAGHFGGMTFGALIAALHLYFRRFSRWR